MDLRVIISSLLVVCTLALARPVAARADPANVLYDRLGTLTDAGDCKGVVTLVEQSSFPTLIAKLPENSQLWADRAALACVAKQHRNELLLPLAMAATALPGAEADVWRMRLWAQDEVQHDDAAAVATLEAIAGSKAEILNAIPPQSFSEIYRHLEKNSDAGLRRRMLKVASLPAYQPDELGMSIDGLRVHYAQVAISEGNRTAALTTMALIRAPEVLLAASVDRQLRPLLPANFDIKIVYENEISRMRELAAAHQRRLAPVIRIATDLSRLGRDAEARATLENVRPDGAGADFEDKPQKENWWWDALANAEANLGNYDGAAAAMRHGIAAGEQGTNNVSQVINFSELAFSFGRYSEALALLAPFKGETPGVSPYGSMQVHADLACTLLALGRREEAAPEIAYVKTHADDAPLTAVEVLAYAADLDGAAALEIALLSSPNKAIIALLTLSDYAPQPAAAPHLPRREALLRLRERSDVQVAIANAGGIGHFDIQAQ